MSPPSRDTSPEGALALTLYKIGKDLESRDDFLVSSARGTLARLRRSLTDPHYLPDVYDVLLDAGVRLEHDPEQDRPWLLVCGLYALNTTQPSGRHRPKLGAALAELGNHPAAEARFRQLLASNYDQLESRLPAVMKQLAAKGVALDFRTLTNDLTRLHAVRPGSTDEHRVRLTWARDYKRRSHLNENTEPQPPEEGTDS